MGIKFEKIKGEHLVVIGLAGILLIIVLVIFILSFQYSQPEQQTNIAITVVPTYATPTPSTSSNLDSSNSDLSNSDTTQSTADPNLYSGTYQRALLDELDNRTPLSGNDSLAVSNILSLLPKPLSSGVLYQNSDIIIDYTFTVNEFQVEILTPNLDQAKAEANVWFRAHGLSQKGICDFPVNFYLSSDVANVYRGKNLKFDPLPNGCT